eukprot:8875018-Ditylum_brightwellii.AAC.1
MESSDTVKKAEKDEVKDEHSCFVGANPNKCDYVCLLIACCGSGGTKRVTVDVAETLKTCWQCKPNLLSSKTVPHFQSS